MSMVVAAAAAVVVMFMAASAVPGTLFMLGVMCSPGLHWLDTRVSAILRKYILMATIEGVRRSNGDIVHHIQRAQRYTFLNVSKN